MGLGLSKYKDEAVGMYLVTEKKYYYPGEYVNG